MLFNRDIWNEGLLLKDKSPASLFVVDFHEHTLILFYYNGDKIPSTEMEWYYQRDRCNGCTERRKKKVLCYRKWTKDGSTFRIQDYLPNSYDRYQYWF